MNVEYGSELYLYYAVDKASVEGTPKLEVVTADGSQVLKTVTAFDEETVNGTACYIFKTSAIAPGQINVVEYVRAVGDNGEGDIVSYSVEQYLYERLFKQGFAAKTEADGKDYNRRNLYFGLLEYSRSAQNLFYRDSEDKIGDSIFVAKKGDTDLSGEYAFADVITLAAPAIEGFDYWRVTVLSPFGKVLSERKLGAGFAYTLTNSAVIIPVTDDDAAEDVEIFDPSVITFDTTSDKFQTTGAAEVVTYSREYDSATGEWYLSIDKVAGASASFKILPTAGDAANATVAEIAFDLYIPATDLKWDIQSHINTNTAKDKSSPFRWAPFLYSGSTGIKTGAWNRFKIVYAPTKFKDVDGEDVFTAKVYINNMETAAYTYDINYSIGKENANIPKLTDIYCYCFTFNNASNGKFLLDNVSFVYK
jgi:hypothetical protein